VSWVPVFKDYQDSGNIKPLPVLVQAGLKNTNRYTAMNAVTNINTNVDSKEPLINEINTRDKKMSVRGAADFNDAVAQGDALIKLKKKTGHGEWGNVVSEKLTLGIAQINRYVKVAKNKEYLVNCASTRNLTIELANKLIKEKNKAEKEAKLKAEGKPIPAKKPKKKKTLKEVGFDAPPTNERVL